MFIDCYVGYAHVVVIKYLAHFFNDTFSFALVLIASSGDIDKVAGVDLTGELGAAHAFALT